MIITTALCAACFGSFRLTNNSNLAVKASVHGFGLLNENIHFWASAQFPIVPSFLILLHKNKPFSKFLLNSMLNNTQIYSPKEISSCQLKKGSYSHNNILPDNSYSWFFLFKRSFLIDFKIVVFIYIHRIRDYWQTANWKSAQPAAVPSIFLYNSDQKRSVK